VLAALAGALVVACSGGDHSNDTARAPDARARPFMLGFSSLPRDLTPESFAHAIDFAGDHGELLLIERGVPWADFLPGSGVSDQTARNTRSETDAIDDAGLDVFFAIDPTDSATGRDRLGGLPVSHNGRRFGDADVQAAFVAYAEYVALNYKPRYLALGVEMNLYYATNRDDFGNYRALYEEARAAVKRKSPDTQVSLTFQYEDLQGLRPRQDKHFPDWQLITQFDPVSDFTAISTYPGFAFAAPDDIPANYYRQLRAFTDKPIVIAEMGYASRSPGPGATGGTEDAQASFLRRVLRDAEALEMPFAVWFAIWDPAYAEETEYRAFESIGLLAQDNAEKPAWSVWRQAVDRPYGGGRE
jgi:hypothetical protein